MEHDDRYYVVRTRLGDGESFGTLLARYTKPVYRFLFYFVRDKDTLEDLTQETFIKAWKNLARFDETKSFKVWLFAIAKNTALDFLKKRKEIPFTLFENDEGERVMKDVPDEAFLPDEIFARKDAVKELEKKLEEISPDHKALLTLRYREDLSLSEIAEVFGEPYNTVKSRHQRAIRSLKDAYLKQDASQKRPKS